MRPLVDANSVCPNDVNGHKWHYWGNEEFAVCLNGCGARISVKGFPRLVSALTSPEPVCPVAQDKIHSMVNTKDAPDEWCCKYCGWVPPSTMVTNSNVAETIHKIQNERCPALIQGGHNWEITDTKRAATYTCNHCRKSLSFPPATPMPKKQLESVDSYNERKKKEREEHEDKASRTGVACPKCGEELRWGTTSIGSYSIEAKINEFISKTPTREAHCKACMLSVSLNL